MPLIEELKADQDRITAAVEFAMRTADANGHGPIVRQALRLGMVHAAQIAQAELLRLEVKQLLRTVPVGRIMAAVVKAIDEQRDRVLDGNSTEAVPGAGLSAKDS